VNTYGTSSLFLKKLRMFRNFRLQLDTSIFGIFALFLKLSNIVGGTPFTWDLKKRRAVTSKGLILRFNLQLRCLIGCTCWMLYPVLQAYKGHDRKTYKFTISLFYVSVIDLGSLLLTGLFRDQLMQLITCLLRFMAYVQGKLLLYIILRFAYYQVKPSCFVSDDCMTLQRSRNTKMYKMLIKSYSVFAMINSSIFLPLIIWMHYIMYPDWPVYGTSLLQKDTHFFTFAYIAFATTYPVFLSAVFFNLSFTVFLFLSFAVLVIPLTQNELRPNMSNYTTKLVLRKPTELQRFYRSLEILVSLFNHTVRPIIIPLQSLIGNFSVFCNVTLITEWTKMDGVLKTILSVWAIIALFSWGPILHFGGRFHANSCETVKSWKFFERPKKAFV
jgi:hypothetical protein